MVDQQPFQAAYYHRCRLFDTPSLLYDPRWLGTDTVRIELTTSSQDKAKSISNIFKKACSAFHCEVNPVDGALEISEIKVEKKKIDPMPILKLIDYCLWCEPNKIDSIPLQQKVTVVQVGHPITVITNPNGVCSYSNNELKQEDIENSNSHPNIKIEKKYS